MPPSKPETPTKISTSPGLAAWMEAHNLSFAFTSYDSGFLYLVGQKNGDIGVCFRKFGRTMGLTYFDETLYLASDGHILELENDESGGDRFDAVFIQRRSNFLGRLDAHEIAITGGVLRDVIFANTAYSCVSTPTKSKSFDLIWKPSFISKIVPEDRCHLNGLTVKDGALSLVSICNTSDCLEGWRSNRGNGGMIFDVQNDVVLASNLSMPHSPRWYKNQLAYCDSGRGLLVIGEQKIFCPGFLRGLFFEGIYALVTVSLPREGVFHGLELQDNLKARGGEAWCGVLIVNAVTGAIENWFRIEGETRELFDVVVLPNIKCPTVIAPSDPSVYNRITMAMGPYQPKG